MGIWAHLEIKGGGKAGRYNHVELDSAEKRWRGRSDLLKEERVG